MMNPFTPKISMFILHTVCHKFHIFALSLTYFQDFPGSEALFQDFPVFQYLYEPCLTKAMLHWLINILLKTELRKFDTPG